MHHRWYLGHGEPLIILMVVKTFQLPALTKILRPELCHICHEITTQLHFQPSFSMCLDVEELCWTCKIKRRELFSETGSGPPLPGGSSYKRLRRFRLCIHTAIANAENQRKNGFIGRGKEYQKGECPNEKGRSSGTAFWLLVARPGDILPRGKRRRHLAATAVLPSRADIWAGNPGRTVASLADLSAPATLVQTIQGDAF